MALNFGLASLQISATAGVVSLGRLQSVSITLAYELAQLRGGTLIFPTDTQSFNGSCEGQAQYADIELSSLGRMIGGSGAFAGAGGSGLVTITALSKPSRFQLIVSGRTNGFTGTISFPRVYFNNFSLDFSRTEYMQPNVSFMVEADPSSPNTFLTYQQ